jgi:1,4-alpha-glucan branching enzyme
MKEQGLSGKLRVTFSMPAGIWADTIHLVGDFNGWNKTATPLRLNDHNWSVSLELDAEQCYQYRYLINGTDWYNDWRADDYRPNELGGDNSVVMTMLHHDVLRNDPHDPLRIRPIHGRSDNVLNMRQRTSDEAAVALQKETA